MKRIKYYFSHQFFILFLGLLFTTGLLILKNWQKKETFRFVKQLGPGLNLGNTLDTHDLHYETNNPFEVETYWGNPVTTKEMIRDIKEAGFDVLRIPVTWYEHMDEDDMVDETWFKRVQELVDYGLEVGMYVVINAHHDPWYTPSDKYLPTSREKMANLWSQIAERFKEYDHRLLFESMNEPRLIGEEEEWGEGTPRSREIVNELNDVFVKTIRENGGKNTDRYLLLPSYCARTDEIVLEDFQLPEGERLIISVHLYSPYNFTLNINGTPQFHGQDSIDTHEIDKVFKNLKKFILSKGIPVMITEFSAVDKQNEQERTAWTLYVLQQAKKLGISSIWWDAGPGEEEGKPFPLYNRYTQKWLFPNLKKALTQ